LTIFRSLLCAGLLGVAGIFTGGLIGCAFLGAAIVTVVALVAAHDPFLAGKFASLIATIKASYATAKAKIEAFVARLRART